MPLRFFTVYNPRQPPDFAIRKFAERMLLGEPISVYGDCSTRRDYIYVEDIVQGVRAVMDYDASAYEVISLGNDRTVTLARMIEVLEDVLGVQARIERQPAQPGDVPQTWADIAKAKRLLGYRASTTFEEGVAPFAERLGTQEARTA